MKGWLVILVAIGVPGGAILAGVIWWRRQQASTVSTAWCQQRERFDSTRGIDNVTIVFPIRKAANERGTWNAAKLRKRA